MRSENQKKSRMFLPSPCVICLDELGDSSHVAVTPCGHFYHAECLRKWLRAPSAKRISAGVEQWLCATCKSWHKKLTPPTWSLYLEAQASSSDGASSSSPSENCSLCSLLRQRYEEVSNDKEEFAQRCEHLIAETQRQESEKNKLQREVDRAEQKARRAEERVKLQNERSEELQARVDTLTAKLRAIEKYTFLPQQFHCHHSSDKPKRCMHLSARVNENSGMHCSTTRAFH